MGDRCNAHGVSDFCITVGAVDPLWRCVFYCAAQSAGEVNRCDRAVATVVTGLRAASAVEMVVRSV